MIKKLKAKKTFYITLMVLCALLMSGCPSAPAVNDKFTVDMFTSPVKPEGLAATRGNPEISISWKKDPSVSYYDLYKARNYNGKFTKYATFYPVDYAGDEIEFIDDADSTGSVSLYYVEAVKNVTIGVGQHKALMSEPSDIVVGSTEPKVIAQSPRKMKELKLTWMDYGLKSMEGPLFDDYYYKVIRNDEVVFNTKELETDQCSWIDTTALPDTKYYYTVELYFEVGDGEYKSVESNSIEFDTSVNYVPSPINPESVIINDMNHVESNGKLAVNDIELKWHYDVPNVLISKNEELIPQFKIERTVAGLDDWKIVAYYDAITSTSTENLDDRNVRRFNYEYHDTSCLAGTSYEYRITVRYQYGADGITEQDEEPVALPTIARTIAYPMNFHLSDYPADDELRTHNFDIALNWKVPSGYEKEGLFYVIERTEIDNGATADAASWVPVGEPIPVDLSRNGIYQVYDKFECTLEEMSSSRDFSYRISLSDGALRSDEFVMDDYFHINNIYEKFEIIKNDTFNASIDRADGVLVSWNVEKHHVLETAETVDVAVEDLYFILSCDGVVIKEGNAVDAEFINNPTETEYVFSYLHKGPSEGSKYSLEAVYKQGVPEEEFSFKTSIISGKTLLSVEFVEAETSAADFIPIVFHGDPAAAAFQIHYRYEGETEWLTDDTLIVSNEAVPEADENAIFETVRYVFEFGLLNDDSANRGRTIEFAITMTDRTGSKNEPTEPLATGSYFGVYGMEVTASQAVENGVATADRINLAWSAVDGAEAYLIYRSVNPTNGFVNIDDFQFNKDNLSGSDKFNESDNMSGTFYYKVVPYKSGIDPQVDIVPACKGTFFAPPSGIKATKGSKLGNVEVTWNPVDQATGYNIYRRAAGTEDEWDRIGSVGRTQKYVDSNLSVDVDFEYTVDAMYARKAISFIQNKFNEQENVGYAFFDVPDNIKLTQGTDGKYVLEWLPVKGATHYNIRLYDVMSGGTYEDRVITVPATDALEMRYVISDPDFDMRIEGDSIIVFNSKNAVLGIAAENDSVKSGKNGTSYIVPSDGIANNRTIYTFSHVLDSLIENFGAELNAIDTGWDRDWWPDSSGTQAESPSGTVSAVSASGGFTRVDGSITVKNLLFSVAKSVSYKMSTDGPLSPSLDYGHGGKAGFLGYDYLQHISGKMKIFNADGVDTGYMIKLNTVGARSNYRAGEYEVIRNGKVLMKFKGNEVPYILEGF